MNKGDFVRNKDGSAMQVIDFNKDGTIKCRCNKDNKIKDIKQSDVSEY